MSEIIDASSDKASRLARESRPLHKVVPLRRKVFFVGDDQDFCNARFVNLEKIESATRTVLVGDSQCFWHS